MSENNSDASIERLAIVISAIAAVFMAAIMWRQTDLMDRQTAILEAQHGIQKNPIEGSVKKSQVEQAAFQETKGGIELIQDMKFNRPSGGATIMVRNTLNAHTPIHHIELIVSDPDQCAELEKTYPKSTPQPVCDTIDGGGNDFLFLCGKWNEDGHFIFHCARNLTFEPYSKPITIGLEILSPVNLESITCTPVFVHSSGERSWIPTMQINVTKPPLALSKTEKLDPEPSPAPQVVPVPQQQAPTGKKNQSSSHPKKDRRRASEESGN